MRPISREVLVQRVIKKAGENLPGLHVSDILEDVRRPSHDVVDHVDRSRRLARTIPRRHQKNTLLRYQRTYRTNEVRLWPVR